VKTGFYVGSKASDWQLSLWKPAVERVDYQQTSAYCI
jgi:hypothetical protein